MGNLFEKETWVAIHLPQGPHKGYHILWEGRDLHTCTWKEWYIAKHQKETRDSAS